MASSSGMAVLISLVRWLLPFPCPLLARCPLFLGVASFALMTDDAHHMSLLTLLIQGVAHGLAVDGQTLISRAIDFVPALQGLVQLRGRDADQHMAQAVLSGHDITTLFAPPAKALSRFLPQALRPIRDGLVTAHPAQHGPRGDPQHHGQTMAPPLGPAGIGNLRKKIGRASCRERV